MVYGITRSKKQSRKQCIENKAVNPTRKVLKVSKKMGLHFYDVWATVILEKSGSEANHYSLWGKVSCRNLLILGNLTMTSVVLGALLRNTDQVSTEREC